MNREVLQELIETLNLRDKIELESIPNLDLYMDQVITLFEDKLGHTKRYEADKLLTKTMINNYTKDKLLMPAYKKKYTKAHVLLMIVLYDLKQILSIADIKILFGAMVQEDKVDLDLLIRIYEIILKYKDTAVDELEEEAMALNGYVSEMMGDLVVDEGVDGQRLSNMLQALLLIEKANYYKRLAERLIDQSNPL